MAYDPNNLSALTYANGFTLWHYKTTGHDAAVDTTGYFNNAARDAAGRRLHLRQRRASTARSRRRVRRELERRRRGRCRRHHELRRHRHRLTSSRGPRLERRGPHPAQAIAWSPSAGCSPSAASASSSAWADAAPLPRRRPCPDCRAAPSCSRRCSARSTPRSPRPPRRAPVPGSRSRCSSSGSRIRSSATSSTTRCSSRSSSSGMRPSGPDLPVRPERVTVYAVPGHPFLVGYQSGDCMIAFLAVDRQRLLQWLRPRLGWSI